MRDGNVIYFPAYIFTASGFITTASGSARLKKWPTASVARTTPAPLLGSAGVTPSESRKPTPGAVLHEGAIRWQPHIRPALP